MSISISDVLENAFAEWFDGDEFESREEFENAVETFVDGAIEDMAKVGRYFCKMTNHELADCLSVYIKDEAEDEEDEDE